MPRTTIKKQTKKKSKTKPAVKRRDRTTSVKNKQVEDLVTFIIIADSPLYRMKSYGPVSLIQINKEKVYQMQLLIP